MNANSVRLGTAEFEFNMSYSACLARFSPYQTAQFWEDSMEPEKAGPWITVLVPYVYYVWGGKKPVISGTSRSFVS
jgi:hypothetical protein